MDAEDEQKCDYAGSQYQANLYRSRNTDHSNFKYGKLKNTEEQDFFVNVTTTTTIPEVQSLTVTQNTTTTTSSPKLNTTKDIETPTIILHEDKWNKKNMGLNETILNIIRHLIDNQLTEKTFSCGR